MTDSQTAAVMGMVGGSIAPEHVAKVYEALADVDDVCAGELLALPMKKKSTGLLLSIFLGGFGAGRFYVHDYLLGGIRVGATVILGFIMLLPILNYIAALANLIWYIAECVLTYRRVREDNFDTIMGFLKLNKRKPSVKLLRSTAQLESFSA